MKNMANVVNKRWRFLTAFVGLSIVIALVLAACGGTTTPSSSATNSTPAVTTPSPTAEPTPETLPLSNLSGQDAQCSSYPDKFGSNFEGNDGYTYDIWVFLGSSDCLSNETAFYFNITQRPSITWSYWVRFTGIPSGYAIGSTPLLGELSAGQSTRQVLGVTSSNPQGFSVDIYFYSYKIDKIILKGNGTPYQLSRIPS